MHSCTSARSNNPHACHLRMNPKLARIFKNFLTDNATSTVGVPMPHDTEDAFFGHFNGLELRPRAATV